MFAHFLFSCSRFVSHSHFSFLGVPGLNAAVFPTPNARQRVQAQSLFKAQRLKAKLCKLKRDILEPSGGGGGKVAGFEARDGACQGRRRKQTNGSSPLEFTARCKESEMPGWAS